MLKDSLFLVLCILLSASCFLALLSSSLPILRIILCIFLWIAYSKGRSGKHSWMDFQKISGTAFASYIVNYVLAGILVVTGLIAIFSASNSDFINAFIKEFQYEFPYDYNIYEITTFIRIFGLVMLLIGAGWAVINAFGRRYICTFLKTLYLSIGNPQFVPEKVGAAKAWFIVFAVFDLIALATTIDEGILGILSNLILAVTWIIASMLIGKYFSEYR